MTVVVAQDLKKPAASWSTQALLAMAFLEVEEPCDGHILKFSPLEALYLSLSISIIKT